MISKNQTRLSNLTTTVGPWITWVWTAWVHLYMDIFQKISTKVLHSPRLAESEDAEQWILRANYKAIVRFWLHRGLCACVLSCFSLVWLFSTLYTIAHQAPLSMGFSRQEYLSGLPFPSPGNLPDPGIEPKDRTQVSRIAGRRFNLWATRADPNAIDWL